MTSAEHSGVDTCSGLVNPEFFPLKYNRAVISNVPVFCTDMHRTENPTFFFFFIPLQLPGGDKSYQYLSSMLSIYQRQESNAQIPLSHPPVNEGVDINMTLWTDAYFVVLLHRFYWGEFAGFLPHNFCNNQWFCCLFAFFSPAKIVTISHLLVPEG